MKKLSIAFFVVVGILATASATMAQTMTAAADNQFTQQKYLYIAAGFGFALAAAAGAIGQSRIASAAVEGAARNPGAAVLAKFRSPASRRKFDMVLRPGSRRTGSRRTGSRRT
ncbi:MAG: hypothetical protein QOE33_3395, partial [Acidobacteriota bacterium]|nr:hypothetical protein [Acidobacteriota bacterium]